MLLRRMVETQGEDLLTYLDSALPQLLTRADARELVELVTLVNQLVLKYRAKVVAPAAQKRDKRGRKDKRGERAR